MQKLNSISNSTELLFQDSDQTQLILAKDLVLLPKSWRTKTNAKEPLAALIKKSKEPGGKLVSTEPEGSIWSAILVFNEESSSKPGF